MEVNELIYDFSALFRGEQKNFTQTDGSLKFENEQLHLKGEVTVPSFSDDIVCGKADFVGLAQVKADIIELVLDITTKLTVLCSRCSIETEKNEKISVTFILTNSDPLALSKAQNDNADVVYIDNGILDVDELVLQTVILSLPIRFLCKSDCKGLCPKCGADLNKNTCNCPTFKPDPRLAKLKDYLTKYENHTNEEVE